MKSSNQSVIYLIVNDAFGSLHDSVFPFLNRILRNDVGKMMMMRSISIFVLEGFGSHRRVRLIGISSSRGKFGSPRSQSDEAPFRCTWRHRANGEERLKCLHSMNVGNGMVSSCGRIITAYVMIRTMKGLLSANQCVGRGRGGGRVRHFLMHS